MGLGVSFFYGFIVGKWCVFPYKQVRAVYRLFRPSAEQDQDQPIGLWRRAGATTVPNRSQRDQILKLKTLGYLRGSKEATDELGVTRYDRDRAYEGLNFFTSGHAPQAFLMDMQGELSHTWQCTFEKAFGSRDDLGGTGECSGTAYWRRAHLFPNGGVLAIFEGLGLIKLDADSELIWARKAGFHHDIEVTEEGDIYVLQREVGVNPLISNEQAILEEYVTVLNSDGETQRRVNLLDAISNSPYAALLKRIPSRSDGDVLHTNTIELLDGKLSSGCSAFRAGNVLVSFLWLDAIAVIDMETEAVVWAMAGMWKEQHQPTVLPNGRMLILDNNPGDGPSRVLEFDPFSQHVYWIYEGNETMPFFTASCGSNQRLPNGNTLITETENGRAFEVTPDKDVVWQFVSPYRVAETDENAPDNGKTELIAHLLEVVRIPSDYTAIGSSQR